MCGRSHTTDAPLPEAPKPEPGVCSGFILGILTMVLGRYLLTGYLDP